MSRINRLLSILGPVWGRAATAFAILVAVSILFGVLVRQVRSGDTLPLDNSLLRWVNGHSTDTLDIFFVTVSTLGDVATVTVSAILLFGYFLSRRDYRYALFVAMSVIGSALINLILKASFERQRPQLWEHIVTETSFSFPSGHAMGSSSLAITLILIFWKTKWRLASLVLGALYMVLVGFSRLYLGVHYPTDIIGGWLISAGWVFVCASFLLLRFASVTRQKSEPLS